jgi:hypothetical protein
MNNSWNNLPQVFEFYPPRFWDKRFQTEINNFSGMFEDTEKINLIPENFELPSTFQNISKMFKNAFKTEFVDWKLFLPSGNWKYSHTRNPCK